MGTDLAPGANLAALRKERGWSQVQLAKRASISVSLLSKIEVGDRTLTPAVAAAVGKPMGLSMAEVLGEADVTRRKRQPLEDLRAAIRDYDLPRRRAKGRTRIRRETARQGQSKRAIAYPSGPCT